MNLVAAIVDRMGVPPWGLRFKEQTLLRAAVLHFLKMGFGTPTSSYTSDYIRSIRVSCGTRAGGKVDPVSWLWAVVSYLLFETHDILGTGPLPFQNLTHTISYT
jgi:hypothetical protein